MKKLLGLLVLCTLTFSLSITGLADAPDGVVAAEKVSAATLNASKGEGKILYEYFYNVNLLQSVARKLGKAINDEVTLEELQSITSLTIIDEGQWSDIAVDFHEAIVLENLSEISVKGVRRSDGSAGMLVFGLRDLCSLPHLETLNLVDVVVPAEDLLNLMDAVPEERQLSIDLAGSTLWVNQEYDYQAGSEKVFRSDEIFTEEMFLPDKKNRLVPILADASSHMPLASRLGLRLSSDWSIPEIWLTPNPKFGNETLQVWDESEVVREYGELSFNDLQGMQEYEIGEVFSVEYRLDLVASSYFYGLRYERHIIKIDRTSIAGALGVQKSEEKSAPVNTAIDYTFTTKTGEHDIHLSGEIPFFEFLMEGDNAVPADVLKAQTITVSVTNNVTGEVREQDISTVEGIRIEVKDGKIVQIIIAGRVKTPKGNLERYRETIKF